ncbi:allatostatin-A receptor-like [Diadema setosum]|uniref:allatostatin-A receptor-like n=1 Tax=Diadema setosum TaxID=31175 RepID=UPI003B3AE112
MAQYDNVHVDVATEAQLLDYELTGSDSNTLTAITVTRSFPWSWNEMVWSWYEICELVTSILGISGNLLVVIVIFCRPSRGRSTDTLVGNLAIADFLTSLFLLPYPTVRSMPTSLAGSLFCKFMRGDYFMWTSVTASIYSLLTVSFDRFLAVVYPIRFKRLVTRGRVSLVIISVWIWAALSMSPVLFINKVDGATGDCVFTMPNRELDVTFGLYTFAVQFAIPTVTMLCSQLAIVRSLNRAATKFKTGAAQRSTASFHTAARDRVLTLTFTIVLIYVLCWSPNQIAFLAYNLRIIPATYLYSPFNRVSIAIAFCNSCINPFLYTLRHPRFRDAVRSFFGGTSTSTAPIFEEPLSQKPRSTQDIFTLDVK